MDNPPNTRNHLAEQLFPACENPDSIRYTPSCGTQTDQASEQIHLSWTTFSTISNTELPVCSMGGPAFVQGDFLHLRRYSGDVEIPLPEGLLRDAIPIQQQQGAAAADPQMNAHSHMLGSNVNQLKHICPVMDEIGRQLSVNNAWEVIAGELGLSCMEVAVYQGIFRTHPGTPPGQTFLRTYLSENDLTLQSFLQTLLAMTQRVYHQLAKKLWTAALLNNSPFYLNLRNNGRI